VLLALAAAGVALVGVGVAGLKEPASVPPPIEPPAKTKGAKATRPEKAMLSLEADAAALDEALAALAPVPRPATGPDIVVIVLDTLRADRLGVYGGAEETSPRLDAWARDARVYDRMVADGTWTLPSHASLFTGLPARTHGVHGVPKDSPHSGSALSPDTATVAAALSAAGWRTAGIVANRAFLAPQYGLDRGFDLWHCDGFAPNDGGYPRGARVTALAERFLARERDAPVFLFVNYMDAHAPWQVREALARSPERIEHTLLPHGPGWKSAAHELATTGTTDARALRSWSLAYDAAVRGLDADVGALLDRLPALGVGDDDYVLVLSDHGELLGEHGLVEHGKDVYEELVRVPLIVRGPGYSPGRDATPVQHHDVATMLLAAAGLPPLPGAERTTDLQVSEVYWARKQDLEDKALARRLDRVRHAFRVGDEKLVVGDDGSEEAYDLAADPSELRDLDDAAWAAELRARGDAWLAAHPMTPARPPGGAEDAAALKALGYVE
jgi:arylsulfatase A-like enzyme